MLAAKLMFAMFCAAVMLGTVFPPAAARQTGTACGELNVRGDKGTVAVGSREQRFLTSQSGPSEIKTIMPCYTGETEEIQHPGNSQNDKGGGVFYANLDIYFYTMLNIIEIR